MQITLQVDPSSLRETVDETIKNFSQETKEFLVAESLKQAVTSELRIVEKDTLALGVAKFREKFARGYSSSIYTNGMHKNISECTDEDIIASREFKEWYKETPLTLKDNVYITLTQEITKEAKSRVKKLMATDPVIQKTLEKTMDNLKTKLPEMIQLAMAQYFTNVMSDMMLSLRNESNRMDRFEDQIKILLER